MGAPNARKGLLSVENSYDTCHLRTLPVEHVTISTILQTGPPTPANLARKRKKRRVLQYK